MRERERDIPAGPEASPAWRAGRRSGGARWFMIFAVGMGIFFLLLETNAFGYRI